MGTITKVVPVTDFDVEWHEAAILRSGKHRVEFRGVLYPSDEAHAEDKKAIEAVKRGLEALTPAQRKASRWPSKDELRALIESVGAEHDYEVWFGPYKGPWRSGSITHYGPDKMIDRTLMLNTQPDGTYYCESDADTLRLFATAVARIAGPQVTFLAEDYSPADFTALIVAPS